MALMFDLPAADAIYHQQCNINFRTGKSIPKSYQTVNCDKAALRSPGRPEQKEQKDAFEKMDGEFHNLVPYNVPVWAQHLQNIPTCFVKLSNLNTPVHKWNIPGLPDDVQLFIKRDDLTGAELSGNKVRALQILFAEALEEGATHVVTGGGPQSGHCRAVSLICRSLGLKPHIVIDRVEKKEDLVAMGNILLYRMAGSQIYVTPLESYTSLKRRIGRMQHFISDAYKEKCYCIPSGGATGKAVYAFITLFEELLQQGLHERFDDIVLTVGTGGTSLGVAVANSLTGS
ncbi:uncharacterized protein LOC132752517 [Ruditapes philippinarum]|uniref:uncharacterized protein LOC132752517 n=1 Tax=Ruditapes philippinarum TaxID=129788 RepID=UPI00295B7DB1|nr:uncharacterized protein LOC132752517 [Ruditapes philippinarum]